MLVGVAAFVLLVAACAQPGASELERKAPAAYTFAFSSLDGLLALDASGKPLGRVREFPQASSVPTGLSISGDGTRLVLSLMLLPSDPRGFGADIYSLGFDGSDPRPLLQHESENVFYGSPTLTKDQVLYAHRRAAVMADGRYVGNTDEIVRLDLRTGARRVVVRDGADLALSPDGTFIVYVHQKDGSPDGLWRVNVDGSGAGPFIQTVHTWWYVQSPRFSPDGSQLAFSAAGLVTRSRSSTGGRLAHLGVPSDLYVVDSRGWNLRELTRTNDDVWPAWSPDGKRIAYVAGSALHVLDAASGQASQLIAGETYSFGELIWRK